MTAHFTLDDFPADDVGELEALVSGVTQTSQSTLLLKKRKEMREVDDALEFMKEEYATRMQACEEEDFNADTKLLQATGAARRSGWGRPRGRRAT